MARPGSGGGELSLPISRDVAVKAVDALLQWLRNRELKPQLLEDDEFVYLQISVQRFPSYAGPKPARVSPYFLPIPHPIFTDQPSSASLCVFFDDRSPSASAAAIVDRARSLSLPVEVAIGLSSLRSDYRPFEARRRLCNSYDLFFADRRIIALLPRLIGKEFFRQKKAPLPVDFSRIGWPQQIRNRLDSAFLHPPSKGTCAVVKVGRASMTAEEVTDNLMAVIEGAMEHVPKGFANLRSVHVKAARSVALPIYQAVPQMGLKITVPSSAKEDLRDEHDQDQVVDTKSDGEDEQLSRQKKKKKQKGRIHEEIMGYLEMNENDIVDEGDVDEDEGEDEQFSSQKKKKKQKKGRIHEENMGHLEMNENDTVDEGDVDEDENGEEVGREVDEKSTTMKKRMKNEGKTKDKKEKKGKKHSNEENFDARMQDNDHLEVERSDASVALNKKMMKAKAKTKKLKGEVMKSKKTKLRQT